MRRTLDTLEGLVRLLNTAITRNEDKEVEGHLSQALAIVCTKYSRERENVRRKRVSAKRTA